MVRSPADLTKKCLRRAVGDEAEENTLLRERARHILILPRGGQQQQQQASVRGSALGGGRGSLNPMRV